MSDNGQWNPGQETTVTAGGKAWRLSRCTRRVWRGFADYAAEVTPDPIAAVARIIEQVVDVDARVMRKLMAQDQEAVKQYGPAAVTLADKYPQMSEVLTQKAIARAGARLNYGSPELADLLNWRDVQVRVLWLLLQKHQPGVTEDEAEDILNEIGPEAFVVRFNQAAGHVPPPPEKKEASSMPPSQSEELTGTPSIAGSSGSTH